MPPIRPPTHTHTHTLAQSAPTQTRTNTAHTQQPTIAPFPFSLSLPLPLRRSHSRDNDPPREEKEEVGLRDGLWMNGCCCKLWVGTRTRAGGAEFIELDGCGGLLSLSIRGSGQGRGMGCLRGVMIGTANCQRRECSDRGTEKRGRER